MSQKGLSFSIFRLNSRENGWGVVDDATGALINLDEIGGLALRLTKQRAIEIAEALNRQARENGDASGQDPDR